MFQTSYESYSGRAQRLEDNARQQQKSARISQATKGKKKKRKAKSKGRHRVRVVETSGTLRDTTTRRRGESITTNVNIVKKGNRRGGGRPPASAPARVRYGTTPAVAFGNQKTQREETSEIVREIRRVLQPQQRQQPPPNVPAPPPVQQRDIRQQQQRERQERAERQQREREEVRRIARAEAIEDEQLRRDQLRFDAQTDLDTRRLDIEEERVRQQGRGMAEINARIAGLDRDVRAGQQIAPPQITVSPNIEVNPVITVNPTFNNNGNVEASRRGRTARGGRRGGGGGRQNFRGSDTSDTSEDDFRGGGGGRSSSRGRAVESSSESSSSESEADRRRRARSESVRTKRERRASAAEIRSPTGVAEPPVDVEARAPEEEAQTLFQLAGGGIATAGEIGAGALGTAGSVISRGAGGVATGVASRLPSAEDVGQTLGGGLVDVAGIAGRTGLGVASAVGGRVAEQLPSGEDVVAGASNLLAEAMRPIQEEQPTSALLESISDVDVSGGEYVVPFDSRAPLDSPRRSIAETIRERQEIEQRQLLEQQEEDERNRRIRREQRGRKQQEAQQGEQAGILADIQSGIAPAVGTAVGIAGNLLSDAVGFAGDLVNTASGRTLPPSREVGRATTTLSAQRNVRGEDEDFSSEGEGAGKVLIKSSEPQASFNDDFFALNDLPRGKSKGVYPDQKPSKVGDVIDFADGRRGSIEQFSFPHASRGGLETPPHLPIAAEKLGGNPQILIKFDDGSEGGINYKQLRDAQTQGRVKRKGRNLSEPERKVLFASVDEVKTVPLAPQPEPEPSPQPRPTPAVPLPTSPKPREQPSLRRERSNTPASGPPTPDTSGDESGDSEGNVRFKKDGKQYTIDKETDIIYSLDEDGDFEPVGNVIDGERVFYEDESSASEKETSESEVESDSSIQSSGSSSAGRNITFEGVKYLKDEDEQLYRESDLANVGELKYDDGKPAGIEFVDSDEERQHRKDRPRDWQKIGFQTLEEFRDSASEPDIDSSVEVAPLTYEALTEGLAKKIDDRIPLNEKADLEKVYTRREMEERRRKGIETGRFKTKIRDQNYVVVYDGSKWVVFEADKKGKVRSGGGVVGQLTSDLSNDYPVPAELSSSDDSDTEYKLGFPHPKRGRIKVSFFDKRKGSGSDSDDLGGDPEVRRDSSAQRAGRVRKLVESDSSGGESMDSQTKTLREINAILSSNRLPKLTIGKTTLKGKDNFLDPLTGNPQYDEIEALYLRLLELKSKVQKKQRRKKSD